jgi:GAF domain-containing protein
MSGYLPDLTARLLDRMARGDAADAILSDLCISLERQLPNSVVGVTVLDGAAQVFEHGIFPSLADDYAAALKGLLVADKPGSCALAVFDGKTIDCSDVAFDGRFSEGWKQLGLKHGFRALVSIPAMKNGRALGTLVVTYPPGRPLSEEQRNTADAAADLVAQVLSYRGSKPEAELREHDRQSSVS